MQFIFRYAAVSDIGNVRKNNEDNLFVPGEKIREPKNNTYSFSGNYIGRNAFFCVCDGMGGHSAGEVASYMAARQVEESYKSVGNAKSSAVMRKTMKNFISELNDSIYSSADDKPELKSMGTTLSGLYFIGKGAYFVNIGDSRSYELKGKELVQLTMDHSDSENKHALTRFLGMSSQYGHVYPDIASNVAKVGMKRRFLLCSDGLTDMVDDMMIKNILIEEANVKTAAQRLVDTAKKNGGRDNVTVIVIDAEPSNKLAAVIRSKITAALLAVLIIAAAGTMAYMYWYNLPKAGDSFVDLSNDIKNAHDLSEATMAMDAQLNNLNAQLTMYKEYSGSVDESDPAVKAKNDELKQAVAQLAGKINEITDSYNEIVKKEDAESEEKMTAITALADNTEPQTLLEKCAALKDETAGLLEAWKARVAAENAANAVQSGNTGGDTQGRSSHDDSSSHSAYDGGNYGGGSNYSGNSYSGGGDDYSGESEDYGGSDSAEPQGGSSQFAGRE